MLNDKHHVLITTAPFNYAGAGTAHARTLAVWAKCGLKTEYISFDKCFHEGFYRKSKTRVKYPKLRSDAYPHSDAITKAAVCQEIITRARANFHKGYRVTLVGTFLFPFYE